MNDNVQYETGERISLTLRRLESSIPWGFRLQGGTDFSTPLSVQVVQPNSVAEKFGLESGDAIEMINNQSSDTLTHEDAKKEIIRSGNEIGFIIVRGAVRIWKPQVTPMSELKPSQLNIVHTATGDQVIPVQKTSLARPQQQESAHIGSSHNRAARPFGGAEGTPSKQATATVIHSQFNSPIGLYSADNIAQTYSSQTRGITDQVHGLDLSDHGVGTRVSGGTYQVIDSPTGGGELSGFRSVRAPEAKPAGSQPNKPSLSRCYACDMLITGVFVKASGQPYHVQCLKCTSCSMNLKQKGFIVVDGKLYCDVHAKRAAQPPGAGMVAMPTFQ